MQDDEPGAEDGVCRPVECPPEEEVLVVAIKRSGAYASTATRTLTEDEMHAERLAWQQVKMQKRMQRAAADVLAKYVPKPTVKSRSGITKPTIAAKKAKNRARRKANKGNR